MQLNLLSLEPKLGALEDAYRQHFLREDVAHWTMIVGLVQLPVVVTAEFDYLLFGWTLPFYLLILARSLFLAYCVAVMIALRRIEKPATYDRLASSVAFLGAFLALAVNSSRPPTYFGHLILDVVLVLVFYLIWPNRLLVRALPALLFSAGNIAMLWFHKTLAGPMIFEVAFISLLMANALGLIVSIRLNNYRRGQFKAQEDLKVVQLALAELAATDALTGVLNRRRFMELAEVEFNRFQRYERPLAFMIIDLDHFKEINDTYGHQAGDAVLKQFASMVTEEKRQSDLFGRLGGEEFALVLPETRLELASTVGERLRKRCEDMAVGASPLKLKVTCSIGVAKARKEDAALEDLMRRTDVLLYLAKESGRNRIEAG
jgi:diguanylate cyclase (GGDEF)-like protein